jgi:2-polyprenyl-3-methyl-5-hydroxy-6-metoxy-1,4-benzoquinol methylase
MNLLIQDFHQRLVSAAGASRWGRLYYEFQYRRTADPWHYATHHYEQIKYQQTLATLPEHQYTRALEIGCAEGVFTEQLARRCREVVAVDFIGIALARAARRCRHLSHVDFVQMDVLQNALQGRFDLVVCGEVFYYMGGQKEISQLTGQCIEWLEPGGHLHLINPWPAAERLHQPFLDHIQLQLISDRIEAEAHRPYAITTFERIR